MTWKCLVQRQSLPSWRLITQPYNMRWRRQSKCWQPTYWHLPFTHLFDWQSFLVSQSAHIIRSHVQATPGLALNLVCVTDQKNHRDRDGTEINHSVCNTGLACEALRLMKYILLLCESWSKDISIPRIPAQVGRRIVWKLLRDELLPSCYHMMSPQINKATVVERHAAADVATWLNSLWTGCSS